jgi:hypothetical protein
MELQIISKLKRIKDIKHLPIIIFLGGFLFDYITLKRIDSLIDNIAILGYLLVLGASIIIVNLSEHGRIKTAFIVKKVPLIHHIIQFAYGALLSNYVIFYLQSASMTSGSIFFVALLILFVGNEFLGKKIKLSGVTVHLCFFFFLTFSYLIFAVPIVTKHMNYYTFLGAGLISVAIIWGMAHFFYKKRILSDVKQYTSVITIVVTIAVTINIFYLMNWIPPVPLSMKFSGIYHDIKNVRGKYFLTFIKPDWIHFWQRSDNPFLYKEGDRVYCYTSIFAPTSLRKKIFHQWLYLDPKSGDYIPKERMGFKINGGREEGFRGFTFKQSIIPGKWKVEVRTEEGLLLGSLKFKIIPDTSDIDVHRETKTIERL